MAITVRIPTPLRRLTDGADSVESAKREINIFFSSEQINVWTRANEQWIRE